MIAPPFQNRYRTPNSVVPATRYLSASPDSIANSAGTYQVSIGALPQGGIVLRKFTVIPASILTPNGTDYYTFQPFFYRIDKESGTQVNLGTARSTLTMAMAAGVPFRIHDESNLRSRPGGSIMVGVTVTVVGTPAALTRLIRPTFVVEYGV